MVPKYHTKQLQNRCTAVLVFKLAAACAVQTPRGAERSLGAGVAAPGAEGPRGGGRAALGAGAAPEETPLLLQSWRNSPRESRREGSQSPGGEGQ